MMSQVPILQYKCIFRKVPYQGKWSAAENQFDKD